MNCNNCTNNNALKEVKIKHVHGNVLRMAIPLTLRTIELVDGEINATDTPFIPSSEHPVKVVFSKGSVSVVLDSTMKDGNIAYIEEKGKIPVGTYAITVTCNDDNGNPYRFKQNAVLYVADATIEAGIEETIEYEVTTWYLDAAIFLALKGEDGVGIDDIETQSSGEIGGVNTVTFILTDGRTRSFTILNGSGAVDSDLDINSPSPIANSAVTAKFNELAGELADLFGDVDYDSSTKSIRFWDKGKTNVLASLDARPFIKDGMVSNAYISNNTLVITFNTDSGKEAIGVPLTSVFNPNNYYTKTQVDSRIASAVANINLSNYYTKAQVDTLVSGKANIDQRTGELTASQATRVVLDYIVGVYDGEDEPAHEVEAGNVWYDNGQIYHSYTGDVEVEIEPLGEPQSSIVYCNAENNKTYRWTGSEFVQVGGSGSGSGGYEPPVGGIPKSDLAQSVQDTLDDVSNKVDKVAGKGLSTEDYTTAEKQKLAGLSNYDDTEIQAEVDAKYEKPSTGIPKTDLTPAVQASLDLADSALQSSDLEGYATTDDVDDAVAALVSSAPQTLDTLKELADALGDDPNFATTMATQLGNKVDKETGKGLSTNDYTTAEKTKLAGLENYDDSALQTAIDGKVDKESGKSLMTDAERTKLQGIAAGAEVNVQPNWTQTNTSADDYIKNKPTLATVATSGSYNDLQDKPTIPAAYDDTTLSGRVSALENAGFITTETDPNVPSWAKADTKPTYTAQEVGALPASTTIPTKTSDLTNDSGFIDKAMYYGTCDTAAATMPKVCTVETFPTTTSGNVTHAKEGTIIAVKFTNSDTNTTDAPSLNVNGIGAKAIMYNNAIVTSTAKNTTVAGTAEMLAYYRYDPALDEGNGAWEFLAKSVDSNSTYSNASLGQGYGTQSNSAAATAITSSISSYALSAGGIVTIKFTYDVPANATLNINSKGAKAIYNKGAAITAGVIKAGDTATFIYSTYYYLLSVDSWQDKQDVINDLATIRSGATAGATALQKSDVSVETQGDGTFVIHVGETDYTISLNHTHEGMVITDVRDIDELPEPEDMDENTIYAGAEDGEISVVYIGGLPFYGGGGGTATPVLRRPSDGDSLTMGIPNNGVIESTINIKGKSLSQSLLVEITGTGFTFGATQPNGVTINQQAETPTATIDAAVANSALGVNVVIAYTGNTMYAEGLLSITGENGISADVSLMSVFTPTMTGIVGQWEGSDSPSGGSWIDRVNNMAFTLGGTANKMNEGYRLNNLSAQKAAYATITAAATTLLNQQIDKTFTCYVECLVKFSAEDKKAQIIDFGAGGASLSGISLKASIYRDSGDVQSVFKNNGNSASGFASSVKSASTGKTFELDTYVPLRIKLGVRLLQNATQEIYVECGEGKCYAILNTPKTINFSGSDSGATHPETRIAAVLGLGYTQDQFVNQIYPNSFADVIYKRILIFNTEV